MNPQNPTQNPTGSGTSSNKGFGAKNDLDKLEMDKKNQKSGQDSNQTPSTGTTGSTVGAGQQKSDTSTNQ